jgi:hypothetical protein
MAVALRASVDRRFARRDVNFVGRDEETPPSGRTKKRQRRACEALRVGSAATQERRVQSA